MITYPPTTDMGEDAPTPTSNRKTHRTAKLGANAQPNVKREYSAYKRSIRAVNRFSNTNSLTKVDIMTHFRP